MREPAAVDKWVVYESLAGPNIGMKSVCTAAEWKLIEGRTPGGNRIIMEDIVDETEAEKLARGTSGDPKPRAQKPRPTFG